MKLFKDKNFLLLMQGNFVSQLGSLMQTFALSLYVLNQYESTTLFASILIVSGITRMILGPFSGVLVDWFDRKKMIVRLDIISGLVVLGLAGLYFGLGYLPLWSIYAISIILAIISTLFGPAVNTVIPTIMKEEDLLDANSVHHMIMTISSLIAPIVGAAVLGFGSIGVILLVNGLSFIVSAISESFIDIPKTNKMPEKIDLKNFKNDFVEGFKCIKESQFITLIVLLALALNFALTPVITVGIPHILKKVMVITDIEYGVVSSIIGIASLVAGILTVLVGKKLSIPNILRIVLGTQSIIVAAFSFIASGFFLNMFETYYVPLITFSVVAFVFMIIITIGNISINTVIQKIVPKELLGRVITVIGTIGGGAVPLGQGLFGVLSDQHGYMVPMILCTMILFVVGVYSYIVFGKPTFDDLLKEKTA